MKKIGISTTMGPIHFEDLEPHRFEDLVRQLIYDFRNWRLLEPTGRLGSDDGYDARGLEITKEEHEKEQENEEGEEGNESALSTDRLWQIQCKREKSIAPKKIEEYIEDMFPNGGDLPYGIIFAAPCDFSKKTRDKFIAKMREKKIQEAYLWGRADLEDMLMQPINDNLLYAYFGISLAIRKRSLKSKIRSILIMKRKVVKHLGAVDRKAFSSVLLRDANDDNYPYQNSLKDFKKKPRWKMFHFVGHTPNGIEILVQRFPAYRKIDEKTGALIEWDYSKEIELASPYEDFWNREDDYDEKFRRAHSFLDGMKENEAGFLEVYGVIPYEEIIDIDPLGDPIVSGTPHIFVEIKGDNFFEYVRGILVPRGASTPNHEVHGRDDERRVKFFPKKFPKVPMPAPLPPVGSGGKSEIKNPTDEKEEFEGLKKNN